LSKTVSSVALEFEASKQLVLSPFVISLPSTKTSPTTWGDTLTLLQFGPLLIPKDSFVSSANIQFRTQRADDPLIPASTEALVLEISVVQSATAITVSKSNLISGFYNRSLSVLWRPNPWTIVGSAGTDQRTPDIAVLVQEMVRRREWASGGYLSFIIKRYQPVRMSNPRVRVAAASSVSMTPTLSVTFTTGQ
jgi:hypothetical protein